MMIFFGVRVGRIGRWLILGICALWPLWFIIGDNWLTMGYATPLVRKVALSVLGTAVPAVLWKLEGKWARRMAVGILLITVPLFVLLWIYAPTGFYGM